MAESPRWRLSIDTGGTFTDCLAVDPSGQQHRLKVLSSGCLRGRVAALQGASTVSLETPWPGDPRGYRGQPLRHLGAKESQPVSVAEVDASGMQLKLSAPLPALAPGMLLELGGAEEAPLFAARLLTGTPLGAALPPLELRLATTRGTNALLESKGAPVVFFVTQGFGDLLELRDQQRPELFALHIAKAPMLASQTVEVDERLDARGAVLRPLDEEGLARRAGELVNAGARVAAVALVHADRHPHHELRAAEILRQAGFAHVRASSQLSPRIGLLHRADTAIVDATLTPIIERFLQAIGEALSAESRTWVMTSAGGLRRAERFAARESLLSGPAAGVVGAAAAARGQGLEAAIAFDMGGTSTDVARWAGGVDYRLEQRVGAARLNATALAIESVAAGGGSICKLSEGQLAVGPESAGASPGPACYGAGGPLTITDVNLLLGRLDEERFALPLHRRAAEEALDELATTLEAERGERPARRALLEGLLALANERMAEAIRKVSLRRGYDPSAHGLVAFGGAGPQHACAVAERLAIDTVIVPADAGLLSARGLSQAAIERVVERQLLSPLAELEGSLDEALESCATQAREGLFEEGVAPESVVVRRRQLALRFVGQDTPLEIELPSRGDAPRAEIEERFEERYRQLYGYAPAKRPLEAVSLRVVLTSDLGPGLESAPNAPSMHATGGSRASSGAHGPTGAPPRLRRDALSAGELLVGPLMISDDQCTTIVEAGWSVSVSEPDGALRLLRDSPPRGAERRGPAAAAALELAAHRFASIAEQMGEMLQRTALSTNIKERLDFSCALLDPRGKLVVNAPHIPVHLGSLGLCVREVVARLPLGPGDVAVTNHPGAGGSHLPDVTVIAPVHDEQGDLLGYVANRAHHAELGGSRPGSMPPDARCLAEEGVVIAPRLLVDAGRPAWAEMRELLSRGPWPSRAVEENLADLAAQVAAAHYGREALLRYAQEVGAEPLGGAMARLEDLAAELSRRALRRLGEHQGTIVDALDDGSPLRVAVTVQGGGARFDLRGSAPVHPGNLNATPAIVRSAILYVLRLLVERPLPLNEGLLEPVEILLEEGLFAPPFGAALDNDDARRAPAVVGGNVETSQRLVNALLAALSAMAYSQGTMNNLLFGNERFGFYETVCGGVGATKEADGASAVHSHMTNTRCTDVEILETRYPVRLERFARRRGSGGAGRRRGGDGVIRAFTFLEELSLSLLGQHRREGPRGLRGGLPGAPAAVSFTPAGGAPQSLGASAALDVKAGDELLLETPGGGGYGAPPQARKVS